MKSLLSKFFLPCCIALLLTACSETPPVDPQAQPAAVEQVFGADPNKIDTDDDGLTDGYEIELTYPYAQPNQKDTNKNGIDDGKEDLDNDGLSNLEEQKLGTHPLDADTDRDGIKDGQEHKTTRTSPFLADTDSDGVKDGRELENGTNPLIADATTVITSRTTLKTASAQEIKISVKGQGDLASQVQLTTDSDLAVPGQIGQRYTLSLKPAETTATAQSLTGTATTNTTRTQQTLRADPLALQFIESTQIVLPYTNPDNIPVQNISVYRLDPMTAFWEQLPAYVDPNTQTVSVETNTLGTFVVVKQTEFVKSLADLPQTCDPAASPTALPIDVALAIDSSGSMEDNDPANQRIAAAKNFINAMKPVDRIAIIDFDSYSSILSYLSQDKTALNAALNRIDAYGGTNIGAGISNALYALEYGPALAGTLPRSQAIILLTDGDGAYPTNLTQTLADKHIRTFTVGLGNAVKASLLQSIASGTQARYIQVNAASDLNSIFTELSTVFGDTGVDTDKDGITDCQEIQGVYAPELGITVKTNPKQADTDEDGISDGEELGAPQQVTNTGAPAQKVFAAHAIANPTLADTDGDGISDAAEVDEGSNALAQDADNDTLNDAQEKQFETDPYNPDTDGDGDLDAADPRPTIFDEHYSKAYYFGQVVKAYVCGDICEIDTLPEYVGVTLRGFTPVVGFIGDAIDSIANTYKGDYISAGLSFAGVAAEAGYIFPPAGVAADLVASMAKHANTTLKFIRNVAKPLSAVPNAATDNRASIRHAEANTSKAHIQGVVSSYDPKRLADALEQIPADIQEDFAKVMLKTLDNANVEVLLKAGMTEEGLVRLLKSGKANLDELAESIKLASKTTQGAGFLADWRKAEELVLEGAAPSQRKLLKVSEEAKGGRYPDYHDVDNGIAREAKMGCENSQRVLTQIAKDAALAALGTKGPYKGGMTWHFYASEKSNCIGPAARIRDALVAAGIPFVVHLP